MRIILPLVAALALTGCGQSMDSIDKEMARREAQDAAMAAANLKTGKDFLARIAKEPGVVTLPSGLMYKVVSASDPNAPKPPADATVKINYEGKLTDGTVFDSSYDRGTPATFPLSRLVKAWQVALPMMHKGDTWMLYVPAELGYGTADMGAIPPNSTLVFKIQLLDFNS
ncbi:MAG: FKBP-type peptidyl-prolyl cis-trans isomerase [Asticcacaulis sp.]|nr:FKBP-type peptidyl-prolyl cis-trans isomerase [Asticcacaulis sp.]